MANKRTYIKVTIFYCGVLGLFSNLLLLLLFLVFPFLVEINEIKLATRHFNAR